MRVIPLAYKRPPSNKNDSSSNNFNDDENSDSENYMDFFIYLIYLDQGKTTFPSEKDEKTPLTKEATTI